MGSGCFRCARPRLRSVVDEDEWSRLERSWRDAGLGDRPPRWLEEFPSEAARLVREATHDPRAPSRR